MVDLFVFDLNFNALGEISEYKKLILQRNYYKFSMLTLIVPGTPEMIELLKMDNIITTQSNPNYGYIIQHFDYIDQNGSEIEVVAYSLNFLTSWRVIERQQRYVGNVEDIIKSFISSNAINTSPNKVLPNLRLAANTGIKIVDDSTKTGGPVSEHCFALCQKHEMSFDILINHKDKKYEVYTWQGEDHSITQTVLPHVIFSKEFDNVIKQNYVNSNVETRTTAIVAGEGEGTNRKTATVNDHLKGFNRRELYVDARDLQSSYLDDNNNNVTLTPVQYIATLQSRGNEKLAEYQEIETYESEIDMFAQFEYGIDYSLGDVVSIRNDELTKVMHARVVCAELTVDRDGQELRVEFGSNIPTLNEKLKKAVR
ncbi:siphovirus ReqiPepy6 Gp37-like family protein [Lysinibacillus sp. NPDC093210]|uniref:siphovirus ReqiPepy6 Gp37-like family protein n=1 Tax=Lysinibacillus sp. NPDC093210 TaxID=3364133 RepID=UPI0038032D54